MLILIEKDPATRVPREVADMDAARALQAAGWVVHVPSGEDGQFTLLADPEPVAEAAAEAPAASKKKVKAE